MKPVALSSERVQLTPPSLLEVPALTAACSAPDILMVLNKQRYTEEDAESWVRLALEGWEGERRYAWLLHDGKRLLGQLSLDRKGHGESAVIGYWLAADARGRGYLTEAGQVMLQWALSSQGADLERVIWAAYEWNESSFKLAKRLGFELVGSSEAGELGWNFRGRALVAHLDRKP